MLRAILNKSWRQQLYSHIPLIPKTIQVRRIRHPGHCWRSKDELISDIPLWTLSHRRAKTGRLARTYMQKLCADTGCSLEDLPGAMNDRGEWRKRVREICGGGAMWWWVKNINFWKDDQLEHTYSSYVRIRDVALKTCQRRWTIAWSGERDSGISVPAAQHVDDIYIYITN